MVQKRSVCGLNTGGRVSRRCIALIRKQQGLSAGFVQKSIELPQGLRASDAGDRAQLLADATGAPLAVGAAAAAKGRSANEKQKQKENRSLHALDFSDGGLEVRGSRFWFDGEWVLNHELSCGSSTQYSLNRAKRWELFDRLYDAIEKRKKAAREQPVVEAEEKPQRPQRRSSLRKRGSNRFSNSWFALDLDDDDEFVPNRSPSRDRSAAKKAAASSYLPFRVRASVRQLRPNYRTPKPHDTTTVAFLDSHAAHCTAVRVSRERSFAQLTSAQQRAETLLPPPPRSRRSKYEREQFEVKEEEMEEKENETNHSNLTFLGSARPDLSDSAPNRAASPSKYERRKRARALHHNQHVRGVQRQERWDWEKQLALKDCKRRRSDRWDMPENTTASDVPPMPTITYEITEPRPVTGESAYLLESYRSHSRDVVRRQVRKRKELARDVATPDNNDDHYELDEFVEQCGRYRSLPQSSTKLTLVAPDADELWEQWPADDEARATDAGFCLSDPLEFPPPSSSSSSSSAATSGVCTRATPSRASTRTNTETNSCCLTGAEDSTDGSPLPLQTRGRSSGSPSPAESDSDSEGCRLPAGGAAFSPAVTFASLFVNPATTTTTTKSRRRCVSSSCSPAPLAESSIAPEEKEKELDATMSVKTRDNLGAAFGWKARVFVDADARPASGAATAPPQAAAAAAAENASGADSLLRTDVPEERVEQLLQTYLASDAGAGDELRVLRSALAHPSVCTADEGCALVLEARAAPKPVYLLLRHEVGGFMRVVSHSEQSPLVDEEVDECVLSVRVKSEQWEGPLSEFAGGAEALKSLEEPVAQLESLSALVLSTLDASAHTDEPADRQRVAGASGTLMPRHWSQRDLNLRYAGRLDARADAGAARNAQMRARCESIAAEQLLRAHETHAVMETSVYTGYEAAECAICLELVPADAREHKQLECGHCVCLRCLLRYVLHAARNTTGPVLKCPAYRCDHAVPSALCIALLPLSEWQELRAKQTELAIAQRSCVRYCPNVRCRALLHCAGAECECREAREPSTRRPANVVCDKCRYHFCLRCGKPAHWPAACGDAAAFESMLVSRADDLSDLLDDTVHFYMARVKRCPSCRQPMEKNSGCQHMKCRCTFEFCWECLAPWDTHVNGNWKCQSRGGIVPLQFIEIGPELANKYVLQQFFYRRALLFRKSYRWAAMTGMQVELNLKRLQELQSLVLLRDAMGVLQELLGGGFQLGSDSFYLLQWFFVALISMSRRRFVCAMRQAGLQMNALSNAARALFRATSQLAFDSHIEPLTFSTERQQPASDDGDGERERTVALKWSAQLEATLRHQMRERQFLSIDDVRALCERLRRRLPTPRQESGSLGTLGLSHAERHSARLHERLDSFLAARAVCQRQFEQSVLLLRSLDLAAPVPAKASSRTTV